MTQLRIGIGDLPPELRKALAEGREVLVEDHGAVVARVAACEKPQGWRSQRPREGASRSASAR